MQNTSGDIADRYLPTYRQAEARLICDCVRSGRSLAFVGVAGIGKSNLVNFLRAGGPHRAGYLDPQTQPALFPLVDATRWERTPESLWKLMLRGLGDAGPAVPAPPADAQVSLPDGASWLLARLQAWLRLICQDHGQRVMFILDDFDVVFETGPRPMLEELNGLRADGQRERLCYLVFTRRLPHVLGRKHDLGTSKFYHLFREDVYALEPHTAPDALHLLSHLNQLAAHPLRQLDLHSIYRLAGGHAQLLKTIHGLWLKQGARRTIDDPYVAELARQPDVKAECLRLLQSLHEEEQDVALRLARQGETAKDGAVIEHLVFRGLLRSTNPPAWFSPVFARFLASDDAKGG